ncbi:MAG TPA: hypothetical protein VIN03_12035 [Roseateles sp.]
MKVSDSRRKPFRAQGNARRRGEMLKAMLSGFADAMNCRLMDRIMAVTKPDHIQHFIWRPKPYIFDAGVKTVHSGK